MSGPERRPRRVQLEVGEVPSHRDRVVLDGLDISRYVRGVEVVAEVGEPTVVRLDVVAALVADAASTVEVALGARALLLDLGWTAPDGERAMLAHLAVEAQNGWEDALAQLENVRRCLLAAVEDVGDAGYVRVSRALVAELAERLADPA